MGIALRLGLSKSAGRELKSLPRLYALLIQILSFLVPAEPGDWASAISSF
jgi:hypothetical protein